MDNYKQRSMYINYIAKGIRFTLKETGLKQLPDSTIIILFSKYHLLAGESQILGLPIFISNINTSYDFGLGFNIKEINPNYKLLEAFNEFLDLYSLEE